MSERELLERAAKAAGIELRWPTDPVTYRRVEGVSPRRTDTWDSWNPLTDDGDALRLAVKLDIRVTPGHDGSPYAVAEWWIRPALIELDFERALVENGDRAAATRLAITRAAAALAKED